MQASGNGKLPIVKVTYSLDEPLDIGQSLLMEVMRQFTGKIINVMINLPGA